MMSHSGFWTRSSSGSGSRRVFQSNSLASLISSSVRWRMKTGLPRHLMITYCCQDGYITKSRNHETYILAFGNGLKSDFNLGLGQDIGGGRHVDEKV